MAYYETVVEVPLPVVRTFQLVSDFRNAALWDPRTYSAAMTTDGPIGVGTRFVLTGGLLRADVVRRLRIPARLAGMQLPYDVVAFDPPHEMVLEGATRLVRYSDRLTFTEAQGRTELRYVAELRLKGPFGVAEPLLQRLFRRIGDDATRGIPNALVAAG